MMISLLTINTLILCLLAITSAEELHPLSDEFINLINTKQDSWEAGRNFSPDTPLDFIKNLLGALDDPFLADIPEKVHDSELIANLPDTFDARDKWPNCPSLNEIRDQGACGSCWAFGAAEAMTDRYCIYSNGMKKFQFSAEDLLSCCPYCKINCTEGGFSASAWVYWKNFGIVSESNYFSAQGCMTYSFPPCEHGVSGNRKPCSEYGEVEAPECVKTCKEGYSVPYDEDKQFGNYVYQINEGEDHIRAEIFTNGPVESSFVVYSDFANYKSKVYRHTMGNQMGRHAIKILGWGVENDIKYWLVANSWNTDWGDNGFFKILRGEDHCEIERSILAGEPL